MNALKTVVTAVLAGLFAFVVAGCGDNSKYKGESAEHWGKKYEQLEMKADSTKPPAFPVAKPGTVEPSMLEIGGAGTTQQRERAETDYRSKIAMLAMNIELEDEAFSAVFAAKDAVGSMGYTADQEVYLGGVAYSFAYFAMNEYIPGNKDVQYLMQNEGYRKIRNALVAWAVANPTHMSTVWMMIRPALRGQYAVLKTFRTNERLLKTPYTRAAFTALKQCLQVQAALKGDEGSSHPEAKRCNAEYKKYGVATKFDALKGGDGGRDLAVDNAMWILKFLDRREADGGKEFAQVFQKFALDYIK